MPLLAIQAPALAADAKQVDVLSRRFRIQDRCQGAESYVRARQLHARPYTACSVTTKSIRPSLSARAHSAGLLMMGSSCTLKLVLTRTGTPLRTLYADKMCNRAG